MHLEILAISDLITDAHLVSAGGAITMAEAVLQKKQNGHLRLCGPRATMPCG